MWYFGFTAGSAEAMPPGAVTGPHVLDDDSRVFLVWHAAASPHQPPPSISITQSADDVF